MAIGALNIALLYRRISAIGTLTVSLWIGTLLTTLAVIVTGALHFDPAVAFDFPPGAFDFSLGFLLGLGAASRVGIYDYLGYYDVCYIGDEVKDPGRVIPRSILISVVAVALIYIGINLSIIGVVPWREFVPADGASAVGLHRLDVHGADLRTAGRDGLHRVRAVDGVRLGVRAAARLLAHPVRGGARRHFLPGVRHGCIRPSSFPHVSLLVIGVIAIVCSTFSLGMVIDALITTRILVQFIGQIVALTLLRAPARPRRGPFRVWLYPLPNLVALFGWIFLFATSGRRPSPSASARSLLGVGLPLWSRDAAQWPFAVDLSERQTRVQLLMSAGSDAMSVELCARRCGKIDRLCLPQERIRADAFVSDVFVTLRGRCSVFACSCSRAADAQAQLPPAGLTRRHAVLRVHLRHRSGRRHDHDSACGIGYNWTDQIAFEGELGIVPDIEGDSSAVDIGAADGQRQRRLPLRHRQRLRPVRHVRPRLRPRVASTSRSLDDESHTELAFNLGGGVKKAINDEARRGAPTSATSTSTTTTPTSGAFTAASSPLQSLQVGAIL